MSPSIVSKELAIEEAAIGPSLFELTGKSFYQLLNQVRIRNATALFQYEDLSINQIGKICGYRSEAYFYKMFKEIMQMTPLEYRKRLSNPSNSGKSYDAWEIAMYILENCRKELSIAEAAAVMNLSQKKINHLLSEAFNTTFKDMLNQFRVQIGRTFLVSLDLSVQETALLVGFSDATTFIRNFKAFYGLTPKKLVQKEKEKKG